MVTVYTQTVTQFLETAVALAKTVEQIIHANAVN
jgi:hypothetical protein